MVTHLHLAEQTSSERFAVRMEEVCQKAAFQAKSIFENAKLSDMLAG
jgi:hypothetical protein